MWLLSSFFKFYDQECKNEFCSWPLEGPIIYRDKLYRRISVSYDCVPKAEESMTEWFCQGCRCQGPSNISCISYQIADKMSIILSLNTLLKYTCSIFCPLYTNIQIHFHLLSKCSECSDLKEIWVWKILQAVYCVARRGCSSTCPVSVALTLTAAAFNAGFTTAALSFLNQWWRGLVTSWIIFSVNAFSWFGHEWRFSSSLPKWSLA